VGRPGGRTSLAPGRSREGGGQLPSRHRRWLEGTTHAEAVAVEVPECSTRLVELHDDGCRSGEGQSRVSRLIWQDGLHSRLTHQTRCGRRKSCAWLGQSYVPERSENGRRRTFRGPPPPDLGPCGVSRLRSRHGKMSTGGQLRRGLASANRLAHTIELELRGREDKSSTSAVGGDDGPIVFQSNKTHRICLLVDRMQSLLLPSGRCGDATRLVSYAADRGC
jgi:hypothetical protein